MARYRNDIIVAGVALALLIIAGWLGGLIIPQFLVFEITGSALMGVGTSTSIATIGAAVINKLAISSAARLVAIGLGWAGFAVLAG